MPFLLFAGYLCASPILKNTTTYAWNAHDDEMTKLAQKRCGEIFKDRSPCLKEFVKIGERDYRAICGEALRKYE